MVNRMADYIDRQAAIDLMMKTPYLNTGGSGYTSEELHLFLAQEIRELPSARMDEGSQND